MKLVILAVVACAAVVLAAPPAESPVFKILRSEFDQTPDGGYSYGIETENGIQQQESGSLKTVNDEENKPHEVVVVRGSYSYTDNDGKLHTVNYIADENGFQPESEDIPKVQTLA